VTLGALHTTPWMIYVKRLFGGAKRLFQYLGRYTHRVGLSDAGSPLPLAEHEC
jgi:hypothetical protein